MGPALAAAFLTSAIVAFIGTRVMIPVLHRRGFVGVDLHKPGRVQVAEMGGIAVVAAIVAGAIVGLFSLESSLSLAISALVVCLLSLIGFYDDLREIRGRVKLVLCILACLAVFSFYRPEVSETLSSFVPAAIIPAVLAVGVASGANAANILAGFNGMEAGTTAIGGLGIAAISLHQSNMPAALLALSLTASCLGFLWYNRHPAKVFPGDVGTLPMGGALALSAILARVELVGPILFAPHLVELACKIRNRFAPKTVTGHAHLGEDGCLVPGNCAALVHFLMRASPCDEKRLVYTVWAIEAALAVVAFVVYLGLLA